MAQGSNPGVCTFFWYLLTIIFDCATNSEALKYQLVILYIMENALRIITCILLQWCQMCVHYLKRLKEIKKDLRNTYISSSSI